MPTELRIAGLSVCSIRRDQLYDFFWASVVQAVVAVAFGLGGLFFVVEEVLLLAALVFVKHRIRRRGRAAAEQRARGVGGDLSETPWGYKVEADRVNGAPAPASLKAAQKGTDGSQAADGTPARPEGERKAEARMRVRALISVVLMAVWLLPGTGGACPTDANAGEGHAHAHGDATPAPARAEVGHDHGSDDTVAHGHGGPRAHHDSDAAPAHDHQPTCCAQSSQPPAAKLAVLEPNPRPTDSSALLPEAFDLEVAPLRSAAEAAFRRPQPPPLPYAKTRRPLLI